MLRSQIKHVFRKFAADRQARKQQGQRNWEFQVGFVYFNIQHTRLFRTCLTQPPQRRTVRPVSCTSYFHLEMKLLVLSVAPKNKLNLMKGSNWVLA